MLDRIAIISDIHGNVPALETTLKDIERRGIEKIYCLGDLAGKGPQSALAVDIIRERCEVVVRGNWDEFLGWETDNPTLLWHQDQLGPERLDYLRGLPNSVDFLMSGKRVRLFHASQKDVHTRIYLDAPYETHLAMFENNDFTGEKMPPPDVVGYGDLHVAFSRPLYLHHKMLFNVGSVGNPLDEPLTTYGILEGHFGREAPAPFAINIVRLPYDIERVVSIATEMEMPGLEPFIIESRTAVYRGRQSRSEKG